MGLLPSRCSFAFPMTGSLDVHRGVHSSRRKMLSLFLDSFVVPILDTTSKRFSTFLTHSPEIYSWVKLCSRPFLLWITGVGMTLISCLLRYFQHPSTWGCQHITGHITGHTSNGSCFTSVRHAFEYVKHICTWDHWNMCFVQRMWNYLPCLTHFLL